MRDETPIQLPKNSKMRHGTTTVYARGCGCPPCREASTEYHRKYRLVQVGADTKDVPDIVERLGSVAQVRTAPRVTSHKFTRPREVFRKAAHYTDEEKEQIRQARMLAREQGRIA